MTAAMRSPPTPRAPFTGTAAPPGNSMRWRNLTLASHWKTAWPDNPIRAKPATGTGKPPPKDCPRRRAI